MDQLEHFFSCPHCGERISMLLDLSVESQDLLEDCEICCRSIRITYNVENGELGEFEATEAS